MRRRGVPVCSGVQRRRTRRKLATNGTNEHESEKRIALVFIGVIRDIVAESVLVGFEVGGLAAFHVAAEAKGLACIRRRS